MPNGDKCRLSNRLACAPPRRCRNRRAFTLLEMLLLLAVIGLMLSATIWAMRMSFDVNRRLSEEAIRQRVMHAILRQLRADLMASDATGRILLAANDAPAIAQPSDDDPVDEWQCTLIISSSRGDVTYDLSAALPPVPGSPALRRVRPSGQSLTRADESGQSMTWSLYGQHLAFHTRPAARGTLLDVTFESRIRFESGDETAHRFVTTLFAEGAP